VEDVGRSEMKSMNGRSADKPAPASSHLSSC